MADKTYKLKFGLSDGNTQEVEFTAPQGEAGKTAYQYAKEGGYTGTEAEFAAKLAEEFPEALPNPHSLTINGTEYDGSEAVNILLASSGAAGDSAGEAGGYYTPAVTQPDAGTMRVAFTPSKEGMPAVEDQTVELPAGTDGKSAYAYARDGGYTGTEAEFAAKLSTPFITPQMYGAKADGVTDDTNAINTAIAAAGNGGTVFLPDGTYLVNSSSDFFAVKIENMSDFTLVLSDGATIKHTTTDLNNYRVLSILSSERITVTGGHIEGDKDTYVGTAYMDWGHGIRVCDSTNVIIKNVEISLCRGDGISLASEQITSTTYGNNKNIVIDNCKIHDIFRNGMHFGSVTGGLVKDTEIYNVVGGNPQAAVDIEAEYTGSVNDGLTFAGCHFHDCGNQSVAISCVASNVLFSDCRFEDGINTSATLTDITFAGCHISALLANSDMVTKACTIGAISIYSACNVTSIGCRFITSMSAFEYAIGFYDSAVDAATTTCIGCEFYGESTVSRALVYAFVKPKEVLFESCVFHLDRLNSFGSKVGTAVFNSCTFTDKRNDAYILAYFSCDSAIIKDCIFDATSYSNSPTTEPIVRVDATNVTVDGCIWRTNGNAKTRNVPFKAIASGDVIFVNNILPQWDNYGSLPTDAMKLLCMGNVLSNSSEYLSQNDLEAAVNEALTTAKASGAFDGKDGTSVTHSWNGTTLTVTSANGTSSANLKGDKGDPGDAYTLTAADKTAIANSVIASLTTEAWVFELEDGTTVTKAVLLK